jgi:hypothetical protein
MEFTPQQRMGYKGFNPKTRLGNWSEDIDLEETLLKVYNQQNTSKSKPCSAPFPPKRKTPYFMIHDRKRGEENQHAFSSHLSEEEKSDESNTDSLLFSLLSFPFFSCM